MSAISFRTLSVACLLLASISTAWSGDAPGCTVLEEDMETGAVGWTTAVRPEAAKIGDPPGPSTWRLDSATCRGGALGSTWFVSNGNDGPDCIVDSARERSQLLSAVYALPAASELHLEFVALSFDEAGTCLDEATFDEHDVGVTTDGGASYTLLNDCTALADGSGQPVFQRFDITAWAGQSVQFIWVYDTRDDSGGHTFAIDDVRVTADVCSETCGDGVVDDGEECDDGEGNSDAPDAACRSNCVAAGCGDGILDGDEDCDDGNAVSGDDCSATCGFEGPACGNGKLEDGETCDDGNTTPGDGCRADCSIEVCGDAIVDPQEDCDLGEDNSNEPDAACRKDCVAGGCGDGILDSGEVCDDGNGEIGDGCRPDCTEELCRDGIVDPDEECDDGNAVNGDGCRFGCTIEECGDGILDPGEDCDDGNDIDDDGCSSTCMNDGPMCGDGNLDAGEQCDDGNTDDGDGCRGNCTSEVCGDGILDPGETCDPPGEECRDDCTFCGDGIVDRYSDKGGMSSGEDCDDGNDVLGDGCRNDCSIEECGDGILDPGEDCDDGNTVDDETCPADCTFAAVCGDGTVDDGEECDDGNTTSGDGCRDDCTVEECGDGIVDPDETCDPPGDDCRDDCTFCGDGIVDRYSGKGEMSEGEDCDDGNETNGDGCRDDCTIEECGDGIVDPNEECDDGNTAAGDGCDPVCVLEGALGSLVLGEVSVDHRLTPVKLPETVMDPVIIAGPPSRNGVDRGVIRLQNVTPNGFEARFDEWDDQNGFHRSPETFPYLALSAGRAVMPDGSVWEAGTFELSGTGEALRVDFGGAFVATPALFLTAQTLNGGQPVSVRADVVDADGFSAALYEEEQFMDGHIAETVGYLAVYSPDGTGSVDVGGTDTPYLLQELQLDNQWTPLLSWIVRLEEDLSLDGDIGHPLESVVALSLGGALFAQDVTVRETDTVAIRRIDPDAALPMEWGMLRGLTDRRVTVPLVGDYSDPVVIVKPLSAFGPSPATTRVESVTPGAFDVRVQEWPYLNGAHTDEWAFYLVVESGQHTLGGLTVEAATRTLGAAAGSEDWTQVDYAATFGAAPGVFTTVQTANEGDAVVSRLRNVDASGFEILLSEQEASDGAHADETVGFVAIDYGSATTPGGRTVDVISTGLTETPTTVNYPSTLSRRYPTVVVDIQTANALDPVYPRISLLRRTFINLFLAEEASLDTETTHAEETCTIFTAD